MCRPRRSVVIEKDSINSVALNETPQDSHQRVLVAGTVSVSSTGNGMALAHLDCFSSIFAMHLYVVCVCVCVCMCVCVCVCVGGWFSTWKVSCCLNRYAVFSLSNPFQEYFSVHTICLPLQLFQNPYRTIFLWCIN